MDKKPIIFNFDMGRKEYIQKMKKYTPLEIENSIKTDKKYFSEYYNINLDKYTHKWKGKDTFIIPYEMADLYCFMNVVMKLSPTYDTRKTNITSENIIDYYSEIVKLVDILPFQIALYIKSANGYEDVNSLIHYLPIISERMSALFYIVLKNGDADSFEKLIDGLDNLYDRFFWDIKTRSEPFNETEIQFDNHEECFEYRTHNISPQLKFIIKYLINYFITFWGLKLESPKVITKDDSRTYRLFDRVFIKLFNALDRENWPEGTESTVVDLLNKWKVQYANDEDADAKIKNEYLLWLFSNEWHVMNDLNPAIDFFQEEQMAGIREKFEEYNDRYNINTLIHSSFLNNEVSCNEREKEIAKDRMEQELSRIKLFLQEGIDSQILSKLHDELTTNGIDGFNKQLHQPYIKHLNKSVFQLILELSNDKSSERAYNLLELYLNSTIELMGRGENKVDNMYFYSIWLEYVSLVINEDKDIDECCSELYENIFIKTQFQKCDYFHNNRKNHEKLKESVMLGAGNTLTKIIKNDYIIKKSVII